MASRLRFGAAALVIVIGIVCAVAIGGVVGDALGIGLGALGMVAIVSLVFYEIGLGEDRERRRGERG